MKLRTLLPAFILILGVALGCASHASADYVLWAPTTSNDQNVFSFQPQGCTMSGALYINAPGAAQGLSSPGNALLLTMPGSLSNPYSAAAADFTIAETGSTWYVYSGSTAGNPNSALLTLGSSNNFGLYYYYNGYIVQPTITNLGQSDEWLLNTTDLCLPVLLADAAPTPIPGAFLLFGSGLAGVFGFRRLFSI